MPFFQLLLAQITQALTVYQLPAVFAGTFFFGDIIVITAFVLAFRLDWSLAPVFLAVASATLAADTFWFFLGRRIFQFLAKKQGKFYQRYEKSLKLLDKSIPFQRPWLVLLYFKFLQGARIFIIAYLSMRKIPYRTFIWLDAIGTAVWLAVFAALAYLIVAGVRIVLPYVDEALFVVTALFVSFVVVRLAYYLILKKVRGEIDD